MTTNDPAFEQKAADIIAFCIDPATTCGRVLRWSESGQPGAGTIRCCLCRRVVPIAAAPNVHDKTAERHASANFLAFLTEVGDRTPPEQNS